MTQYVKRNRRNCSICFDKDEYRLYAAVVVLVCNSGGGISSGCGSSSGSGGVRSKSSPVTGLEWPKGFQEVKALRFHDNGTGW